MSNLKVNQNITKLIIMYETDCKCLKFTKSKLYFGKLRIIEHIR